MKNRLHEIALSIDDLYKASWWHPIGSKYFRGIDTRLEQMGFRIGRRIRRDFLGVK